MRLSTRPLLAFAVSILEPLTLTMRRPIRLALHSSISALLLFAAASVKAEPITFTFTSTGGGSLGATTFTGALLTVRATGDTDSVTTEPGLPSNVLFLVISQFDINIAGVGSAITTGSGYFGGGGYVFDNQGNSTTGFGIGSDNLDLVSPQFATYGLNSSIGPISGAQIHFFNAGTTSGALTFSSTAAGTFDVVATGPTAVTPEPSTLALFGTGILGLAGAARRKFLSC
jgi:hypothetical protein